MMNDFESPDESIRRAKLRAMKLLEQRDYTEARLKLKLKDSGYPDEAVNEAIEYVKSYGYLDDLRYAGNLVRTSIGVRSKREVERKLRERGVSPDIIREAFELEGGSYDTDSEDELIRKLILKRCPHPEELDSRSKSKLFAYMYGKGFSIDRVERILEEVLLDITS